jgi:hypothetical protein
MDSWMDAAHRGVVPPEEDSESSVQVSEYGDDPVSEHRATADGVSGPDNALSQRDQIQDAARGGLGSKPTQARIDGATTHGEPSALDQKIEAQTGANPPVHAEASSAAASSRGGETALRQSGGVQGNQDSGAVMTPGSDGVADARLLQRPQERPAVQLSTGLPANVADAIHSGIEAGELQFQESLAEALAQLAAGVQASLRDVHAAGAEQAKAIDDAHRLASEQVVRAAGSARIEILGRTDANQAQLEVSREHAATTLTAEIDSGASGLRELGPEHDERIRTHTEAARQRAVGEVDQSADAAQAMGAARARAGGESREIAAAKARAAREVAADTAASIRERRGEVASSFAGAGTQSSETLRGQADQAAEQLVAAGPSLAGAIHELYTTSGQTLMESSSSAMATLSEQERASLDGLAHTREEAQAELGSAVTRASNAIEEVGARTIEEAQAQGQAALDAGRQQISEECRELEATDVPADGATDEDIDPADGDGDPREMADSIRAHIETGYAGASSGLMPMFDALVEQLATQGAQVVAGLAGMGTQVQGAMTQSASQHGAQLDAQVTSVTGAQSLALQQVESASKQQTDAVAQRVGEIRNQLGGEFASGESTYAAGLDEQVANVRTDTRAPLGDLDGRIGQAQSRAESRMQKSWLERQLSDLGDMLSSPGFWAGLVTGLLLAGAVILMLSTAGIAGLPLLAVAGISAGIAAASAAVGTMVQNFVDGRPLTENLLRNTALGAGMGFAAPLLMSIVPAGAGTLATVGASMLVGGGLGILGNLFTGENWDKNLLANLTIVGLLSLFARAGFGRSSRPTWREAELAPGRSLRLQGYGEQDGVSIRNGQPVRRGAPGSSRPDYYRGRVGSGRPGSSVDVKRYDITSQKGRNELARDVTKQARKLQGNAPGTRQRILVDTRGLRVTQQMIAETRQAILEKAGGLIWLEDLLFTSEGETMIISWLTVQPPAASRAADRPPVEPSTGHE